MSGLSFTYDPKAPAGSRVPGSADQRQASRARQGISVATNDFLAAGGDGYTAFGDAVRSSSDFSVTGGMMKGEKLVYSDSGRWLRDVVIEWLRGKKRIDPSVDNRIREVR